MEIKNNIKRKVISYKEAYMILIALIWTRTSIVSYVFSFIKIIPFMDDKFVGYLKNSVFIIASILALPYIMKRLKIRDYIIILLVPIIFYLNILLYPTTSSYLKENLVYILCVNFSAYFIGITLDDDNYIEFLYKCSRISLIAFILFFAFFGFSPEVGRDTAENMGLAYRILPHECLVVLFALNNKKFLDIIISFVGVILILACGVRGAIISLILFVLIYFFIFHDLKHRWIYMILSGGGLYYIYFKLEKFAFVLMKYLNKLGLSTRVVEKLISGTTLVDEPRMRIKNWMIELIKEHPFRGYGIAGDRNLIPTVVYSHTLWIELIVSYGIILGSGIMILMFVLLIKALLKANRVESGFIIAMVFGGGLFKLIVSSSYLLEFQFFMLFGYLVLIIRTARE